jgi:hypothetical protein
VHAGRGVQLELLEMVLNWGLYEPYEKIGKQVED